MVISQLFNPTRIKTTQSISRHAQLVLITTGVLIVVGMAAVFLFEQNNSKTIGNMGFGDKMLNSFFQSVTPRTAGYATFDQGALLPATKFIVILLMLIGASPAGTGGGIKTTTFAIVLMFLWASMLGKRDVTMKDRRIATETVRRALTIMLMAVLLVGAASLAMMGIEGQRGGLFTSENIVFEVASAFGTVGLTTGITPLLSTASRLILIFMMYVGRVGLLTLVVALAMRSRKDDANIRYPEERFMVG